MQPDEVIPAALRAGLISAEAAVTQGVLAEPIGLSHPVWRVSIGAAPAFVLKAFGPRRGETDGERAREAAVLAMAAGRPAVSALVPRALAWPGPEPVVVTEIAGGRPALNETPPDQSWPMLVAALAEPLAALHRATRDLAAPDAAPHPVLAGAEPWVLRLFDGDGPAELWAMPPVVEILAAFAADPACVPMLRRARGAWRRMCLIHGDLKQDNALIDAGHDPPRATLVDWEMACIGDPAWDISGLLSRLLLAATPGDPPWSDAVCAALAGFLARYAPVAKLPLAALAQRAALYAGAWLLMNTLQVGARQPAGQALAGVQAMLTAARATLQGAEAATARIVGQST